MRALPCLLLLLSTSSSLSFLLSPPSASPLHVCPSFPYCFLEKTTGLWAPLSLHHLPAPTYQASPVNMMASLPPRALPVAAASPRDSPPCWLAHTYCTARPSNTLATRGQVVTAELCQEECAKELGCEYFTFTRRRGRNRCSLLSECTISARCQVGPNCASGRPKCSCPQIKKDSKEDPDTRYARWSCGSVDPYTSAVPTGTVCKTTCPAWRNKGLESTCQPDGRWSYPTQTVRAAVSRLAPLILPYTGYATPDQPDMVCGCKDVGPFDYDPTAEDGAEVVCRDSDPPKFSSGQGWSFTTTNYCTLFCNKEPVVDVYCQGSRWQGEPERGLWCYSQPENPAPGKISASATSACTTVTGGACVFPFTYSGQEYNSCTLAGGETRLWCSLNTDSSGNHMSGSSNWGYCLDSCPGASPPAAAKPAAVDGKWTPWKSVSSCSNTCGAGAYMMRRQCDNPAPAHGGQVCRRVDGVLAMLEDKTVPCQLKECPTAGVTAAVDGQWTPWKSVSSCSTTCGAGVYTMRRQCDGPAPTHGGQPCRRVDGVLAMLEEKTVPCQLPLCF